MSRIAVIGIVGNSVFLPVEQFHVGGETVEASSVHFELGGKGFNQAVAASRCGCEVSFFAVAGADAADQISGFLEKENIEPFIVRKDEPTAFAAIVTDRQGSNRVTVYQGAQLSVDDVKIFEDSIRRADILLLTNETSEIINIAALEIAKKYGVYCVLNPAPARKTDQYILDNVDLFTPNEHETLGIEDKDNVIVTLGKKGCLVKQSGRIIPAVSVGETVDTTGAGDTFNGALVSMLAEGRSPEKAAAVANRVAALGVTRRYAMSSIPTKEEIEKIIEELEN